MFCFNEQKPLFDVGFLPFQCQLSFSFFVFWKLSIPLLFLWAFWPPRQNHEFFFFFFLGRINKTMSLGHGMAFISFLFFCYFSLILDIAIFSFRCLSLSLSLYIYIYIYIQSSEQPKGSNYTEQMRPSKRQFFSIIYYWVKER